jgi:tRNA threonylcarbamoyladenosine biosynthesis protein TsaB
VPPAGLVLGIETATALGGVALVSRDGALAGETTLLGRESHAERLLPALERLLAALGVALGDLAAVAVSIGPGSFTGLRTGIATAKGLALALGVPLYGVPTLEALAANAPPGSGTVCALLAARRGEAFAALFAAGAGGPERACADGVVALDALGAWLPDGCLLVGEPPPPVAAAARAGERGLRLAAAHLNHPRAAAVALAGLTALAAGRPTEIASLAPRYIRPPDAVLRPAAC